MTHGTTWLAPLVLGLALLLGGCAAQVRDVASQQMRDGNYEQALASLQAGLAQHPDSTELRASLLALRADAVARLLAQAAQDRSAGRFDAADQALQRALAIDPGNEKLIPLRTELGVDRRVARVLQEASSQMDAGNRSAALAGLEAGLRLAPRHQGLLALQRRLETETRAEGVAAGRTLAEKRPITLDFRNAPLSTVLEAITRGSGVNFVLDRDVRQDTRVSVYLRASRVEDAIDLVTGAHQLARRIVDPQTVLIYPNTQEKQREHQEQVIRVFHLANADAKTTAALLRSMLRLREVFVDERANLIALREPADIIPLAERLVALHDQADAEVMLEVEVLEVSATRLTELGIRVPESVTLTPLPANGVLTVQGLRDINASRIGVSISPLVLNLRREVGDVHILANPRIRARNREKARILIGDKVPVITSTATATGFVSESVSYLDVGLKLEVEPSVSPDDEVLIRLALEVSSIAREVRSGAGTLAYQLGTRNANTVLRLHDGETQLLGGLISNEDRVAANRVPGLGDLPVAGRLFSSQLDDHRRTELVLAITPRVLRPAPRPDVAQAEMWVGTEITTRLRSHPVAVAAAAAPLAVAAAPASAPSAPVQGSTGEQPGKPPQPAGTRLFWQSPAGARVGDTITVALGIETAGGLRGTPLEIAYTAATLEVAEVLEGDFLRQGGASTSFTHAVNAATGRISIGLLRSDTENAQGRGILLQLRVKARRAGTGELTVASVRPVGADSAMQPPDLPTLTLQLR